MINAVAAVESGGWIASPTVKLVNRTGAVTKVGGLYLLDLVATQAEGTTPALALSNFTPVTTASIFRQYVVAAEIVADDAKCLMFAPLGDAVICRILCDGSGTAIGKGDPIKGVNASDTAVKATAATDGTIGFALEACTTAATLVTCLFYGRGARQG